MENSVENKNIATTDLTNINNFNSFGEKSKYDPNGVIDENIKIRQNLSRFILSDKKYYNDTEFLNSALKAMESNDNAVLKMAKLQVEENSNASTQELAKQIALAAVNMGKDNKLNITVDANYSGREVVLPPPSREFVNGELSRGTEALSEKQIMDTLAIGSSEKNNEE